MSVKSRKPRTKWISLFLNNYQLYTLMLPAITAMVIFAYMPMYGIQIAFKDFRSSLGIWGSSWVGLKHFERFLNYPGFWPLIKNTLSITIYSLALFSLPVVMALQINELENQRFKKTVQMISYAPHFLSTVVVGGLILLFLGRSNGIINNFAVMLGGKRVDFITQPNLFSSIFVWSGVWQSIGWDTIIFIAALASVSPELIEASQIDGATRLQIIRHVKLPSIIPTIVVLFIMSTGGILSVGYEKILLLQNPLNLDSSQVLSTYVYNVGLSKGQYSYASAIGLFNNLINVSILIAVNYIAKRKSGIALW